MTLKLYTSNFAKSAAHPNAVSIANYSPKWCSVARTFKKLAPSWALVKNEALSLEDWEKAYRRQVLEKLDAKKVAEELGDGAIMLCWESAEDFCHRQIVAKWMRESGIEVEEISEKYGNPTTGAEEAKRRQISEEEEAKYRGLTVAQIKVLKAQAAAATYTAGSASKAKSCLDSAAEIYRRMPEAEQKAIFDKLGDYIKRQVAQTSLLSMLF